jgi:hypothetical protein
VYVQLDQVIRASTPKTVDLARLDDQDITSTCFELVTVHHPQTPSPLDELDLVVWVPVRSRTTPGRPVEQKRRHRDGSVVNTNEVVGVAAMW